MNFVKIERELKQAKTTAAVATLIAILAIAYIVGGLIGKAVMAAQAEAYDQGASFGFNECIEENNLYSRYYKGV